MNIAEYLENIHRRYMLGNATEHTFRGDLQQLLETLLPEISATNEPKRQKCGAPDYILIKNDIPVGFIEAKDIGDKDLEGEKKAGNLAQFGRYKASLGNIVFTDYLRFYYYRYDGFVAKISIAAVTEKGIVPQPENFAAFASMLKSFCTASGQTIESPQKLAAIMADKAKMLAEAIEKSLVSDEENQEDSTIKEQFKAFQEILIRDTAPKAFADVYAQTIAYGMFAARCHDPALPVFNRQKAADLIPKSNPFLRKLFQYIAGYDLDERLKWIVDNLAEVFLACNPAVLLEDYGKETRQEDPIIHFYETFLSEYDPALRKARGVWYTPQPVVDFIVRAVDEILKTDFGLPMGLADNTKTALPGGGTVHKVQILDPATGTGTFLAETIKLVHKYFEGNEGVWPSYAEQDLIPRLNGFELLMASYAMAHLQLDLLLRKTGCDPSVPKFGGKGRLKIYLTNSLEEHSSRLETSFASWLSAEANEANWIKRDAPVMVVMGNPPYSASSSNKSVGKDGKKTWIGRLVDDYKKGLNEKKSNLDDDYIKFIRLGQHFIDKNGTGVLAYISNNSFIDGITHRQMRRYLSESFDKIYILNLHGNAKKRETDLLGGIDQNVFDIMQGVSINIFVKTGKKQPGEQGKVFHFDLQGKRTVKYKFLNANNLHSVGWNDLNIQKANCLFVPQQEDDSVYQSWFPLNELFIDFNSGVKTDRDPLFIDMNKNELEKRFTKLLSNDLDRRFIEKYRVADSSSYKITGKIKNTAYSASFISKIQYRIFDWRYIYYDKNIVSRPAQKAVRHILEKENIGLIFKRQANDEPSGYSNFFLSDTMIIDGLFAIDPLGREVIAPLYLYPEEPKARPSLFTPAAQTEMMLLKAKLQQAEEHCRQVRKYFEKTVSPYYKGLQNSTEENDRLFEEHRSICEEAEAAAEKIRAQIARKETGKNTGSEENAFPEDRKPNFRPETVAKIAEGLGLKFVTEKTAEAGTFAPLDVLDYLYAVLHSPGYRKTYKEFLKADFPRVPYPTDAAAFWRLAGLGGRFRKIHLLQTAEPVAAFAAYPEAGGNLVGKAYFENPVSGTDKTGRIYINESQYFEKIPEDVWGFYIGGYQPAQKWLKDRKGLALSPHDILHYRCILAALTETLLLMKQIDEEKSIKNYFL